MATNKEKAAAATKAATNRIATMMNAELSIAERKSGVSIAALEDPNALGKLDLLGALAWLLEKKDGTIEANTPFEAYNATHSLEHVTGVLGLNDDDEEGK